MEQDSRTFENGRIEQIMAGKTEYDLPSTVERWFILRRGIVMIPIRMGHCGPYLGWGGPSFLLLIRFTTPPPCTGPPAFGVAENKQRHTRRTRELLSASFAPSALEMELVAAATHCTSR
jgi:hypothetical protein